ncbi:hypothetical protein M407DRAFT_27588, partial [Tulasnella calospora MUT 4182]
STTAAAAQAQDQQEGLPQIKLEAAPSPAFDTINLPDPESPSPLPSSRPLGSSVDVVGAGVRRLGAPTSIDLSGSNFSDYRGSSRALLSAVSVTGFDSHHHHHHGMTAAGSVPSSATTDAFFTVPPPAGAASFHFDHLQAGLDRHHRHIPSAPTSATAETFGALDLSRRPSMDDVEFSGLDVLSYVAMGPTFAAAAIDASAIQHHHHQAGEEGVHGGEVSTQPHRTRSPSPFSEAAFKLGISTAAAVFAPSVSRTSSTLSEDDGPESEDAAGDLEIEGLGDLRATAKEVAEAVEQEFDNVFA